MPGDHGDPRVVDAVVRAVSGRRDVEFRGENLLIGGRRVVRGTPHLSPRPEPEQDRADRAIADGMAVLAAFSDAALHDELAPADPLERVVFDMCEQFRCESLVPAELAGLRHNLGQGFDRWCRMVRGERVGDHRVAMLVYTCVHMVRGRLISREVGQDVDELIEGTRADLARLLGHALAELRSRRNDQLAFAEPAREIARLVAEMAGDAADAIARDRERHRGLALVVPADWDPGDHELGEAAPVVGAAPDALVTPHAPDRTGAMAELDNLGDYRVFTRAYDRDLRAEDLYPRRVLQALRSELDEMAEAQPLSVGSFARRLRLAFSIDTDPEWLGGHREGRLDRARLAGVVANPSERAVHRRPHPRRGCDAVMSFLVDNSGSMKRHRHRNVALLVDTMVRALDLAGVSSEVLGHTTGAWNGGRALKDWRAAGMPEAPGRIGEVDHIVYKSADQRWRGARTSLAALLRTTHFREGLDGEALIWAHRRLLDRPERRRILVVVSDGAPTDAATMNNNRPGFLGDHLNRVVAEIERSSPVELVGLGVDRDLGATFQRWSRADLGELPTLGDYLGTADLLIRR